MSHLTLLFLLAAAQAPAWSALSTGATAALVSEQIDEKSYEDLREGKLVTQRRETPKGKTGVHIASFAIVRASAEAIFEAVAVCEKMPEFMPHMEKCTQVPPDQPLPANERWNFQELKVGVFPMKVEVKVTMHARLEPPRFLSWKLVKGDVKANEGYWKIIDLGGGAQLLVYDVIADAGGAVPDFVQRVLTERDLPNTVEAVRKHVEGR